MDFAEQKKRTMQRIGQDDRSRQGHVDAEVLPLLSAINSHPFYYTTSSCAGRILVYEDHPGRQKHAVRWLLSSHRPVALEDLLAALGQPSQHVVWLRCEPLILHVCCRNLPAAQALLDVVQQAGMKHSGILSASSRIIVEVLGADRLDVPLAQDGVLLVGRDYLRFVLGQANQKLAVNTARLMHIEQALAGIRRRKKVRKISSS